MFVQNIERQTQFTRFVNSFSRRALYFLQFDRPGAKLVRSGLQEQARKHKQERRLINFLILFHDLRWLCRDSH